MAVFSGIASILNAIVSVSCFLRRVQVEHRPGLTELFFFRIFDRRSSASLRPSSTASATSSAAAVEAGGEAAAARPKSERNPPNFPSFPIPVHTFGNRCGFALPTFNYDSPAAFPLTRGILSSRSGVLDPSLPFARRNPSTIFALVIILQRL